MKATFMDINRAASVSAKAEVVINAPISRVWQLQADLKGWPRWNPDVKSITFEEPLMVGREFHWTAWPPLF